jgi:tetratricopeptide (TPR) repeat protein
MKVFSIRTNAILFVLCCGVGMAAGHSAAQSSPQPSSQAQPPAQSGGQGKAAQPEAPKINPKEEADYKALNAVAPADAGKKIQLGQQFLQTYPASRYEESVENQLVDAYYAKQDWNNFYATADKAIEKDPDDVDALAVVGWVIPHLYNPEETGAEKKLSKAEAYEKHAIELLASIPKPPNLTDEQFAQAKSEKLTEAHSGLGLVYFRQMDFDNAAKELQLATANPSPDATDLYVLGISLQQLKRNPEAGDAFTKCAQMAGPLQDRCKQSATEAKSAK